MIRAGMVLWCFFLMSGMHAQQSDFSMISFEQAEYKARAFQGESLQNLPVLVHKLTYGLTTDVEKFRAIYYWVTHNIQGDLFLMDRSRRKRRALQSDPEALASWEHSFRAVVFEKLSKQKSTLCSGYAYLIQKMTHLAGIECHIINGINLKTTKVGKETSLANHAWNTVLLDGKWYLCDATWAAGYFDEDKGIFVFDYDDRYFLMEPLLFAESHKELKVIEE